MKTTYWIAGCLLLALCAFGQDVGIETPGCDCPDCREMASKEAFVPPGLERLDAGDEEHAECDHDHADVGEQAHDEHEGHDHVEDAHDGHDHDAHAEGVEIAVEMRRKSGIQVRVAEGGTIEKTAVFPSEIRLNRDRMATVSPRYASMVRQVFAEIGDEVKKGDLLASLENRETMAVYSVAAPLDGVVIAKNLAVGEMVAEGKAVFEVANLSTVWADIGVFPKYKHLLRKGMAVEFLAHDGHVASGTVKYISPIISHETRIFTARSVLENAGEDFAPGAFVRARITVETSDVAVAVPLAAVQKLDGETVVFISGDHGFEPVPVLLGSADRNHVEIKSGLEVGTAYAAEGAFVLKAQMVVGGLDPHAGHGH